MMSEVFVKSRWGLYFHSYSLFAQTPFDGERRTKLLPQDPATQNGTHLQLILVHSPYLILLYRRVQVLRSIFIGSELNVGQK